MATVPTPNHPRWCDRDNCAEREEHRSRVLPANPAGRELIGVEVFLVELLPVTPGQILPPALALVVTSSPDDIAEYLLDIGQGAALARQIRRLVDASKRGGRL